MAKQIIFYGAGQNAREHFAEWERQGLIPVCFIDEDKEKHNTKFHTSSLDILSLSTAVKKYPDYEIYVTPTREKWAGIVTSLLEQGVEASVIKFFEPVEYRKGCANMGTCFILGNKVGCCCVPDYRENFDFEISSEQVLNFQEFEIKSRNVIDDWRNDRPSICNGCPDLSLDFWEIEPHITVLNISSKDGADFCNTKCIYCSQFPKPVQAAFQQRGREVIEMLETAHQRYPERKFRVVVSGGDIAVAPFRNDLFAILEKYGWTADIYSNSAVYCEGVSERLRDGESTYVTTLDSTVRERFAEIKGVDCLPKVLENIRRYAEAAVDRQQIKIKLIVLDGVYDNFGEIRGVVDFAESIGAELILSCDVGRVGERLSPVMFDLTVRWIEYAISRRRHLNIMYDHFNVEDALQLKTLFKSGMIWSGIA